MAYALMSDAGTDRHHFLMRAILQQRYGSTDELRLEEVEKPVPDRNEVLVQVHAASVNARYWHVMRGDPYLARLALPKVLGWRGPKRRIRDTDVAGPAAAGPAAGWDALEVEHARAKVAVSILSRT